MGFSIFAVAVLGWSAWSSESVQVSIVKPALRALDLTHRSVRPESESSRSPASAKSSKMNRLRARLALQGLSDQELEEMMAQMRAEASAGLSDDAEDEELDAFIAEAKRKRLMGRRAASAAEKPNPFNSAQDGPEAATASTKESERSPASVGGPTWQGTQPRPSSAPSALPCATPQITEVLPQSLSLTAGNRAILTASVSGASEVRWYREEMPISDVGTISGSRTPQLILNPTQISDAGRYRLLTRNNCGSEASAWVTLELRRCVIDFNQDGVVNEADRSAFQMAWENGESSADANYDGGTDGQDLSYFELHFPLGGCFTLTPP